MAPVSMNACWMGCSVPTPGDSPSDGVANGLPGQQGIGADQTAVEQNGRRTGLAGVTAEADTDVARAAQGVAQAVAATGAHFFVAPVDVENN